METSGKDKVRDYLRFSGILLCNVNPYLPSLSDVGGVWNDIVFLLESREAFYCKAYRKRVTYLSREAYFLLRQCTERPPMEDRSRMILRFLELHGPADTETIRRSVLLEKKEFAKAFDFLLEHLYVTMVRNGEILNDTWSTFLWGSAEEWEKGAGAFPVCTESEKRLRAILRNTMTETEVSRFLGSKRKR